ncbi:guanine nucleotide-binding protein g(o) subunit alpha [Anaeramoeba flamelloides]|uniref:Guanine nucleotide-binding protein g(O) subunit alpha n=1 Tax=Anaeramoeba flamelloides TaxID=1746091 RepID=A0AAV7ZHY5_9EUKA|nr:guanine nucleotide-binding protein g(o) subunit alpha [Anaeramoeba flamelloides]KAJ6231731.1 guanine nucleotide-binding protein g(o) subunit alpha [Anaeramoeba flamelloides]
MGCLSSSTKDPELKNNKKIDKKLKEVQIEQANNINLLLIGAGDSGKSTIARQMKVIHNNGFTEKEQIKFLNVIHSSIIENMQILINSMESLDLDELTGESKICSDEILSLGPENALNSDLIEKISTLWEDQLIKTTFDNRALFHIPDTMEYFFNKLDEISQENYLPSADDILHCRIRTTGISTTPFSVNGHNFTIIDVGGQRCERKKWMSCFENITAVLFVTSMSEYNQMLFEDDDMNRMHESILLFEEISNSRWFKDSAFILFLNKVDLFKEKIKKHDLNVCFPDYKGGLDYDNASEYIKNKFLGKVKNKEQKIYVHFTCATDTTNVRFVFDAVKDIILQNILPEYGFL